jgi:2-iminoacetate synthase ThiH
MSEEKVTSAPETETHQAEVVQEKKSSIVDPVFDIALEWVTFGIKTGQKALETAARTLQGTAKTLENVSHELGKKA